MAGFSWWLAHVIAVDGTGKSPPLTTLTAGQHWAAWELPVTPALLNSRDWAAVNPRSREGRTALVIATVHGHSGRVGLLRTYGGE